MYNITVQGGRDTRDPRDIDDWQTRIDNAVIPFGLDEHGWPVNPVEPHLPPGQGQLWHWAEACCADAIVFVIDSRGNRWLLMVERDDDHGWGAPGGGLDKGETPAQAVARELWEEATLEIPAADFAMLPGRYVPDPRAGRGAWNVTFPGIYTFYIDTPPAVTAADDARRAEWLPANNYTDLETAINNLDSKVFASHIGMLREVLNARVQRQRKRGWRKLAGSVIVDRTSRWGNPFTVTWALNEGLATTAAEARVVCRDRFRQWLDGAVASDTDVMTVGRRGFDRRWMRANLHWLRGRVLCCTCPPASACHADVLSTAADYKPDPLPQGAIS